MALLLIIAIQKTVPWGLDAYGIFEERTLAEWKAFTITEILGEGLLLYSLGRGLRRSTHALITSDGTRRIASFLPTSSACVDYYRTEISAKWCTQLYGPF